MSLEINQIALHQLIKRDEQTLEVVLRDSLLEPTATAVEMMAELHRVYSAKNKAYGLFNEESELADSLRLHNLTQPQRQLSTVIHGDGVGIQLGRFFRQCRTAIAVQIQTVGRHGTAVSNIH